MLGLIIRGLLAAAAVAAITVIVVDHLDPKTAEEKIKEQFGDTIGAMVKKREKNGNLTRVTFKDLSSDQEMDIDAENVDDSIREGACIYV